MISPIHTIITIRVAKDIFTTLREREREREREQMFDEYIILNMKTLPEKYFYIHYYSFHKFKQTIGSLIDIHVAGCSIFYLFWVFVT